MAEMNKQEERLKNIERDMEEMNEDLEAIQKDVRDIRAKLFPSLDRLGIDDLIQQLVGAVGFVFPLLFTDEIWNLAASISLGRAIFLIVLTLFFGYIFIGRARLGNIAEQNVIGIPLRLITVALIAYGSTFIIIYIYGLQAYYHLDMLTYFKAMSVFGTFSVIGAIAVDMLG